MTGQTLPLVSHGASAFLCFCIAFGVILSISKTASARMAKEQRMADPLVDRLSDLDQFETGEATMDEELYEDYEV